MRKLSILFASGLAFWLGPIVLSSSRVGVVGGSAVLVALGILLAIAASGGTFALTIAAGALAALGGAIAGSVSPALGGAILVGLAYAERTSRVRGGPMKLVHVAASIAAGACSASLVSTYVAASPAVRGVALVVSSVLVALPMLLDADDALAHSLDGAASDVSEPAKSALREGAEIRRQAHDIPLDASAARSVKKTWQALSRLAEARIRLEKTRLRAAANAEQKSGSEPYRTAGGTTAESVVGMVDQRIADHVKALSKAYSAVDTARAAAVGLDDAALKGAISVGESMDEVSKSIVEVK